MNCKSNLSPPLFIKYSQRFFSSFIHREGMEWKALLSLSFYSYLALRSLRERNKNKKGEARSSFIK